MIAPALTAFIILTDPIVEIGTNSSTRLYSSL